MHHSEEGNRQLCFWSETSGRIQPCTQEVGETGDGEVKGRGLKTGQTCSAMSFTENNTRDVSKKPQERES